MKAKTIIFLSLCLIIPLMIIAGIDMYDHLNPIKAECPYEGAECPNVQRYLQDYQIQLHDDTVWIYDADRLVGSYISNWNNQMDSILIADNQ